MAWTPEKIELLRKLWEEDELTASAIAERFGDVTRNAVIGKVHRLKLPGRRRPGRRPAQNLKPVPQVAKAQQPKTVPRTLPPPEGEALKIVHLRENLCRWPYGEPNHENFRFCGTHRRPWNVLLPHPSETSLSGGDEQRKKPALR